jgi:hypothetical protein
MTPEEILEYNKRCSLFLGWKYNPETSIHFPKGSWTDKNGLGHCAEKGMCFHSDWNWIMEVVESIEKTKCHFHINTRWNEFNEHNYSQVTIHKEAGEMAKNRTAIYNSVDIYKHHSPTSASKKEAVIYSINQFLIWYNKETIK